ncbi:uncharacterized protein LOC131635877 [Vicia villosa]|uniref:uncharacterized protein LOC131635877 n=1 Tax=Vicia villosa TaxID=3911 RepID=UPI00273CBE1C|nr:uncharacterized protein LOC131635877 [Vicia villosa]
MTNYLKKGCYTFHSLVNIRSILVDGVDLGDISVFGNLQNLETLDLVNCQINELPYEISKLGKFKVLNLNDCQIRKNNPFEVIKICPTLEELYFIDSFSMSFEEITLPQLERYRIGNNWDWSRISYSLSKCVAFTDKFNFPSKATYKYCMQTSESLRLNGISITEGWINLMPEIVDIRLGMNDLVELCLGEISQLQCLIDTTGFQVPKVLSKLVALELHEMENLKVLFKGSLSFDSLKYLEKLAIKYCKMLQRLSDSQLNLCNLKTIVLRECPMLVNLSSLLTSRNLTLLENLEIADCENLRNIIIDERGENELRETDKKKYVPMFPKLKVLAIINCQLIESALPLLFSQDLPVLEIFQIRNCGALKYIFRKCQHVELGLLKHIVFWQFPKLKTLEVQSCNQLEYIFEHYIDDHQNPNGIHLDLPSLQNDHQNYNEVCLDLPALQYLELCYLPKLVSICPKQYHTTVPQLKRLHLNECSLDNSIMKLLYTWQRAQYLPLQSNIMCNVTSITLSGISKIKSMFLLFNTSRMLVAYLKIENCDELKHIIVDIGDDDDDNVANNWVNVFPKLKDFCIVNCVELKHIFGHYSDRHQNKNEIHLHFPALQYLQLRNLPSFVAMCPKQYHTTFPLSVEFWNCSLNDTFLKWLKETNYQSIRYLKNWRASHVRDYKVSSYKDLHGVEQSTCSGNISRVISECSLTKCVTVLDEIGDIPQDAYGKALEKFLNPDWREMFIAMSIERKRGWVLGL